MPSGLSKIHLRILEILKAHPEGVTSGQLRAELSLRPEEQTHLDKRKRDLYKRYHIEKIRSGALIRYFYRGERLEPLLVGNVNLRKKAEVFHKARGRCQMCGRTIEADGIVLVVDHKIPLDWVGSNETENLWALCYDCNQGKKNYFASQDTDLMKRVMPHKSVHVRIGELLKANQDRAVPSYLIEFVAGQDDWMKRTRELRYLGWEIKVSRKKMKGGKVVSAYTLRKFTDWPEHPSGWIREYERRRAAKAPRKPRESR